MKTIENEVIGDLRYLTVEFDQTELVTGGMGVISQDAVKRYFIEKRPDLKVKKCGGLKLDSQRFTVTMRIGVVNTPAAIQLTGADGSKIEGEKSENVGCGERKDCIKYPLYGGLLKSITEETVEVDPLTIAPSINQKLLNSGYDEVQHDLEIYKNQYDELRTGHDNLIKLYDVLVKEKDELHAGYGYDRVVKGARKDDIEFHELQKKYNAGVLLRNKLIDDLDETNKQVLKLQRENDRLVYPLVKLEDSADLVEADKQTKPLGLNIEGVYSGAHGSVHTEDAADLAAAKEVIAEDDTITLDVVEGKINNG